MTLEGVGVVGRSLFHEQTSTDKVLRKEYESGCGADAFNLATWEAEVDHCDFNASLAHTSNSRSAITT